MKFLIIILISVLIEITKCDHKEAIKSKNPLPYFRREVEEVPEDPSMESPLSDDSRNLVSVLVKNAKTIFNDLVDANESLINTTTITQIAPTRTLSLNNIENNGDYSTNNLLDVILHGNLSLTTLIDHDFAESITLAATNEFEMTERSALIQLSKNMKSLEKAEQNYLEEGARKTDPISQSVLQEKSSSHLTDHRRSCISCNNVRSENCNNPKNTLISSTVCDRDGDLCYSMHTPFGVIDRGCFNVDHNLTTYVCSCNLCNYISISEMPYIFSNKQDWADNVVELSRTRKFRKSVFKDMSCLWCEVSTTSTGEDMFDNTNCLEGTIGSIPTQKCKENEICGVQVVRNNGYVWRGCVSAPLYNYWWALCDSDLCNYETLVSMYDFI